MRMRENGSEGPDVCHSVCFIGARKHKITLLIERECVRVCLLDSPRPGAADHLEVRGRLKEE